MRTPRHPETSHRMRAGAFLLAVALASSFQLSVAHAAPSEREKQQAADLMDAGDAALASGRALDALDRYRRADRIMEVPTTHIAVAHALARLNRLVEARDAAVETQRMPQRSTDPPAFQRAREEAARLERDLTERIPTLAVTVQGLPASVTPSFLIDGKPWPDPETPVGLNPGRHVVVALVPGSRAMKEEFDLGAGKRRTVVFTVAHRESRSPPQDARDTPTLAYLGFGIGVTGVTVGAVTGLLALRRSTDLEDQCAGKVCPTRYDDELASARAMAKVSNITFGVGLAGVALGAGALMFREKEDAQSTAPTSLRIVPDVRPLRLGVRGSF